MGLPSSRPVWRTTLSVGTTLMLAATGIAITAVPVRAAGTGPCDIYASGGTPCVAAHSTTRALFGSYNGALYQVRRWSDGGTTNVGVVGAGGVANAATQDNFCSGTYCTIVRIYDQTTRHNDLTIAPGGGANPTPDQGANAAALPVTAGGRKVYGVYISAGNGYRNNATNGVATGSQPEGMYMVTEGTHVNDRCCFDYGNAETNNQDTGNGDMDAIYFGNLCWFSPCSAGPRVAADLENGLFAGGDGSWTANTGRNSAFVTAVLKNNGTTTYAIKDGNAQSGGLATRYDGALPNRSGYRPMTKQGAIILGIGGDNSNSAIGNFFEGVMTQGYPSDTADNQVQANIVGVGYGAPSPVAAGTLNPGSTISLRATTACCTTRYVRHQNNNVVTSVISSGSSALDKNDGSWIVRRGLADQSCVSFESRNYPGDFLRHFNFQLLRQPMNGSTINRQDATFCPVSVSGGTQFRSLNFPTRFIRHFNNTLYIASNGGSNAFDSATSFAADTTWAVSAPWAP